MKNGNSGSGAAAAEADNATLPIASAPKAAAARRVFNLMEWNIVDPCFGAHARQFRRVVGQTITGQAFQDVCTKPPKWFHRGKELFQEGFAERWLTPPHRNDLIMQAQRANLSGAYAWHTGHRNSTERDAPVSDGMMKLLEREPNG